MSAVQPRINKAISDALRADSTLTTLFVTAGGTLDGGQYLPLYWTFAPPRKDAPYLVYGPTERQSQVERSLCGGLSVAEIPYQVGMVTDGVNPDNCIAVVDRLATLLSGLSVVVDSMTVTLSADGDYCYPDYTGASVTTHTGLALLARVTK